MQWLLSKWWAQVHLVTQTVQWFPSGGAQAATALLARCRITSATFHGVQAQLRPGEGSHSDQPKPAAQAAGPGEEELERLGTISR